MRAVLHQSRLAQILNQVSRAVSSRSTLPVLANVLVTTDEGRLKFSATELEISISAWADAHIEGEGQLTLPACPFAKLVGTFPSESVVLEANLWKSEMDLTCGPSNTRFKGIDASEFPPVPLLDKGSLVHLPAGLFKKMLQQTVLSPRQTRPAQSLPAYQSPPGKAALKSPQRTVFAWQSSKWPYRVIFTHQSQLSSLPGRSSS